MPRKNLKNILGIPGVSQNNIKPLFSSTMNYIQNTLVNLKITTEKLVSLNSCPYPYVLTDRKSEAYKGQMTGPPETAPRCPGTTRIH